MFRWVIGGIVVGGFLVGCRSKAESNVVDAGDHGAREGGAVAEVVPRCRNEGASLPIAGDDIVAGEGIVSDALYLGVVRRAGNAHLASIVRAGLDLGSSKTIDLGPSRGDEPPPRPFVHANVVHAAFFASGGSKTNPRRDLVLARVESEKLGAVVATISQQADESFAFDLASPNGARSAPIVAWDEDAPIAVGQFLPNRGVVKVQLAAAGEDAGSKSKTVSPEASDAESPRIVPRSGGYWIAWLSRRAEEPDAGVPFAVESAAEARAFRWVEIRALDSNGEPTSPVRRVSPDRGHAVSFELLTSDAGEGVDVIVQDEASRREGGGATLVRYHVDPAAAIAPATDLVDGGVGHAFAEIVADQTASSRWLAWTDLHERSHLVPLRESVGKTSFAASAEPVLDRTRLVAVGQNGIFVVTSEAPTANDPGGRIQIRRVSCR